MSDRLASIIFSNVASSRLQDSGENVSITVKKKRKGAKNHVRTAAVFCSLAFTLLGHYIFASLAFFKSCDSPRAWHMLYNAFDGLIPK